jgi:hypothetical protein
MLVVYYITYTFIVLLKILFSHPLVHLTSPCFELFVMLIISVVVVIVSDKCVIMFSCVKVLLVNLKQIDLMIILNIYF